MTESAELTDEQVAEFKEVRFAQALCCRRCAYARQSQ